MAVPRTTTPTAESMARQLVAVLAGMNPELDGEIYATIVPSGDPVWPHEDASAVELPTYRGAWVLGLAVHERTELEGFEYPLARALRAHFGAVSLLHYDDQTGYQEFAHFTAERCVQHLTSGNCVDDPIGYYDMEGAYVFELVEDAGEREEELGEIDSGAIQVGGRQIYGERIVGLQADESWGWLVWRPGGVTTPTLSRLGTGWGSPLRMCDFNDLLHDDE